VNEEYLNKFARAAAATDEYAPATNVPSRVLRCLAVFGACLALFACRATDSATAAQDGRSSSVRRSDTFQSAVARGELLAAASNAGALVVSENGGKTWTRTQLPQPSSIIDLTVCSDGLLIALDFYGKIWVSDAAAKQWNPRSITSTATPMAITCDRRGNLWVVGSDTTILNSADRGGSWQTTSLKQDAILRTVQFVDEQHGFVSGEFGTLITTVDGGKTWQPQPKVPNDFYPYAAYFADSRNGWLAGLAGTMLHTDDGGETWQREENRSGASVNAFVGDGNSLFGLGDGGAIALRRNGLWVPLDISTGASAFLSAGALVSAKSLFVVGAGGELRILDVSGRLAAAPPVGDRKPS